MEEPLAATLREIYPSVIGNGAKGAWWVKVKDPPPGPSMIKALAKSIIIHTNREDPRSALLKELTVAR